MGAEASPDGAECHFSGLAMLFSIHWKTTVQVHCPDKELCIFFDAENLQVRILTAVLLNNAGFKMFHGCLQQGLFYSLAFKSIRMHLIESREKPAGSMLANSLMQN